MTTLNGMSSGPTHHHHYEEKKEEVSSIISQKGEKSGRSSREAQRSEQSIEKNAEKHIEKRKYRFAEKQKKGEEKVEHKNKTLLNINNSQHQYQHKVVGQKLHILENGHSFSSGTSSFGSIGQNSTVVA